MTYAHKLKYNEHNKKQDTFCFGRYYNFKSGLECCKNKNSCKKFIDIGKTKKYYDIPCTRFAYINDFRTCKLYKL